MTTTDLCLICSTTTRKYKCSKCLQFCCSLQCYKNHQENAKCVRPVCTPDDNELFRTDNAPDESLQQQRLQQFTTDDTVDKNKLAELANSERLKSLLANPHLRDYLVQLDATPDAWKAMKVAMLEPLFVEFANECLAVVEPDVEAAIQPQLTASEQIVSDFCAHVVNQFDGVE